MHDRIQQIRARQPAAHYQRMTEAATAARERKFSVESGEVDIRSLIVTDDIEIPIQVVVFDHRTNTLISADMFKRKLRNDSYSLVIDGKFIDNCGSARAMREIAKRIPRLISELM